MTTRHWGAVWKDARFAPWTKYSDSEIAQLAALRRLYQKHFDCTLEVVEPMKKDKKRAAQNVATGAAVGGVVGGVAGEVSSMATPAVLVPGVAHGQAMLGAGAGAMVGGGVMAAREAAKPVPDHPQEQLWRGGVEQLLLVDKKGYPVLKEATANEKLQNMGAIVSSNSLAYNVNTVLLHMQRYIHHDRVHGLLKRMAFSPNDPRCIFCMILVEWLHKELIPCPEIDRESRILPQLDSWIKFMKDTSAHNVFSTAEAKAHKGYQTMDALLLNIDQQFEQMRFHIEAEVRERSIAEQLRGVSNTGKTLVSRLFQLMTYVLSPDDSVPPFFGINAFYQTIKRPDVIRYVRNSVHGRLMAEIASGPDVQEYLDVWPDENNPDPLALLRPVEGKQNDAEALLYLLFRRTLPNEADVAKAVHCGAVASLFHGEQAIILSFLKVHVHIPVLTRLLLACKEAAFLAGALGELMFLRNDNSRKILEFLVESTMSIAAQIKQDLESLWAKASGVRRLQRVDQSGKSDFQRWEKNWQQAYQIYNGMGTDNDVSQQTDQILRELARVQAKLRNPAANLPQVRYRLNQFVQLLDGVRESCPWLNVDEDLKGLIERQACHLGASLQTKPAPGHAAAVLPVAFPERTLPPATLPGFDAGPLKVGVWDADLPHCLLGDAKGKGPAVEPEDKTYTLEDALREALQAEIETRSKRERDLLNAQQMLEQKTEEWNREKLRLTNRISQLVSSRAQAEAERAAAPGRRTSLENMSRPAATPPLHRHQSTDKLTRQASPTSFPVPVSPGRDPPVSVTPPHQWSPQASPGLSNEATPPRTSLSWHSHKRTHSLPDAVTDAGGSPSDPSFPASRVSRSHSISESARGMGRKVKKAVRSLSCGSKSRVGDPISSQGSSTDGYAYESGGYHSASPLY